MARGFKTRWLYLLTFLVLVQVSIRISEAQDDICEGLQVPMETLLLGPFGSRGAVCIPKWCPPDRLPQYSSSNVPLCVTCDQSEYQSTSQTPRTDLCPVDVAKCDKNTGRCVPDGVWYTLNYDRAWAGLETWEPITISEARRHSHDVVSCGGDLETAADYLKFCHKGIDGVAAVPSAMYGSWGDQSQACYLNNDLCYNVTSPTGAVATVAVWGKCSGVARCMHTSKFFGNDTKGYQEHPGMTIVPSSWCAGKPGSRIASGGVPTCLTTGRDVKVEPIGPPCCEEENLCPFDRISADFCANNDHPHFTVTRFAFEKLCPTKHPCTAAKVRPVKCPWTPPNGPRINQWRPAFGQCENSTPRMNMLSLWIITTVLIALV